MEKQKKKVDSEALLRAARENDYSSPAPASPKEVSDEAAVEHPEAENKETSMLPAASETPKPVSSEEQPKPAPVEKTRKERGSRLSHKELFVKNTSLKARKGVQAYIRPEFHEQIQRIVDVVGKKEVSIASYLDNVLAFHFEMFETEIEQELDEQFKSKYNSNIKFSF